MARRPHRRWQRLAMAMSFGAAVAGSPLASLPAVQAAPVAATGQHAAVSLGRPRVVDVARLPAPAHGQAATRQAAVRVLPFLSRDNRALAGAKAHDALLQHARRQGVVTVAPSGAAHPGQASNGAHASPQVAQGVGTGLAGTDLATQVTAFGQDQFVTPPDTQIAVGPSDVVEMINDTATIWTKTGSFVKIFDLNAFYDVPSSYLVTPPGDIAPGGVSDPRVLYDQGTGRWIASATSFDANFQNSTVYVAVSATSDPAGAWYTWIVQRDQPNAGLLFDEPMTGYSSDKVVISWDDFSGVSGNAGTFLGAETWVLDKQDLLGGVGVRAASIDPALTGGAGCADVFSGKPLSELYPVYPDACYYRLVPAQNLGGSDGGTAYITFDNSDGIYASETGGQPTLGVIAVTGSMALGTLSATEDDLGSVYTPSAANTVPSGDVSQTEGGVDFSFSDSYPPMTPPPPGQQPSGLSLLNSPQNQGIEAGIQHTLGDSVQLPIFNGAPPIATNDDSLLSAVWQNGTLVTAGNDACVTNLGDNLSQSSGTFSLNPSVNSCLRVDEVPTAGLTVSTAVYDFDLGIPNTDAYFPAVTLDGAGNLFVSFTMSSPSVSPSAAAFELPAADLQAPELASLVTVQPGQGTYCGIDDPGYAALYEDLGALATDAQELAGAKNPTEPFEIVDCTGAQAFGADRWGDYSAAAPDPSDPARVWVAAEYAAANNPYLLNGDWGTAIGSLTYATGAPTAVDVTAAQPSLPPGGTTTVSGDVYSEVTPLPHVGVTLGATEGGQPVDVFDAVYGSPTASSVNVTTAADGTFSVPFTAPRAAGDVTVTATAADSTVSGSTTIVVGGGTAPVVTGLSRPPSGPASGGTRVTIDGGGFTGATAVDFGTAAATGFQVVSDGTIVATSPPGTVDSSVYVTVSRGVYGSAQNAAAEFAYGGAGPFPGVAVQLASPTVETGGTDAATLVATAPPGGLGAWTVDVRYDPSVVTVLCGAATPDTLSCNSSYAAGDVRVVGAAAGPAGLTGSPTLANLTLEGVGTGPTALTPVLTDFAYPDGAPVSATPVAATVTDTGPTGPVVTLQTPQLLSGGEASEFTGTATQLGKPLADTQVTLQASAGTLATSHTPGGTGSLTVTTDGSGDFSAWLDAPDATGPVTLTATVQGSVAGLGLVYVTTVSLPITGADVAANDNPNQPALASLGGIAVQAGGGTGAVGVAQYSANPGTGAVFGGTGQYFDVSLAAGSTYGSATITDCSLGGGTTLYWWNGTAWTAVNPQSYDSGTQCASATLTNGTPPSAPTLAQLTGTPFAVGTAQPSSGGSGNNNSGGGGGGGGGVSVIPAVQPGVASGGGTLTVNGAGSGGAQCALDVVVPAGVVPSGSTLTGTASAGAPTGLPDHMTALCPAFSVSGATITTPLVATVQYAPASLNGLDPARISVYRQAADGSWSFVPTAVNAPANSVSAYVYSPETLAVLINTQPFPDVPATYWARAQIDGLLGASVIDGFPDGTFRPDGPLTRAQFVKMLVLSLGLQPGQGASAFHDVPAGAWFTPYVVAAVQAGLVEGLSPTNFGPNDPVTREQMAVLLARALKLSGTSALTFTDRATIDAWAIPSVEEAVAAGYLDGFPNGTFQPLGTTTRAQASKVLDGIILHEAPTS